MWSDYHPFYRPFSPLYYRKEGHLISIRNDLSHSTRERPSAIHLMVKDPDTLFAYWHISPRRRAAAERHYGLPWGEMRKNIRLYAAPLPERLQSGSGDSPLPFHDCRDSRVQKQEAASAYLRPVLPGGAHAADFGILDDDSHFVPLVRSSILCIPMAAHAYSHSARLHPASPGIMAPKAGGGSLFEQFSVYTLYSKHEGVHA
ncbi:MAG: DUF4912 domain-containing protein [Paenibacillus dendritiformis]|uniref:DUF4912 domain-containing protein n=1 Tax=Paenibacillus dendritiformis TaxID=130049 RepID=UPI00143DE622|nr:DUF4912 domain-containing protein [Paenibacillus dendritiformis]MDU5143223.1 DUF4912 domain-containing protein [Paenibacillus dendritiformis]NKI23156.1 DUF4912 domain-containing protein [Paenibacillus dendritiformis]NRF98459.1 DUF4912 domain-containing protein [Paenibacillus dendritiformis]GIO72588.1 hypothetical protein J27TS7_21020 [Paenibacillus dendritiformis]